MLNCGRQRTTITTINCDFQTPLIKINPSIRYKFTKQFFLFEEKGGKAVTKKEMVTSGSKCIKGDE